MKIIRKIEKSNFPEGNKKWLVMQYTETESEKGSGGCGAGRIFKGTKKECQEYLNSLKGEKENV